MLRGKVALRKGTTLPAHLHRAKGEGRERTIGVRLARALVAVLALSPPVALNRHGDGDGGDVCVVGRGSTLVISTTEAWVERRFARPLIDDAYLQRRSVLARHLQCPGVLTVSAPDSLREELITGEHVRDAGATASGRVLGSLWQSAAESGLDADASLSAERGSRYRQLLQAAPRADFPGSLRSAVDDTSCQRWLEEVSYPISHGDLWEENLIVTDDGLRVLDVDPRFLGHRPFWFDPITALMVEDAFHAAVVQPDLLTVVAENLARGTHHPVPDDAHVREVLLSLCALWSVLMAMGVRSDPGLDRERPWTPARVQKVVDYWERRPKELV